MSRVADRVGSGSFGSIARAPRSERGRAKAVAEGSIPEYELQRLQLDHVAPCPMNPRRNYGTEDQLAELGNSLAKRQTTACVAVTREAYLKLWPTHEGILKPAGAEHVLLNGERRYRSAQHVGLDALDFVVRDDLTTSCADFLDYLMIENEEREDFDVIERARGIKQLLDACDGNAAEVGRRRGKDRSWVGNQVALLTLPWSVQEAVASGELAERYGRRLARALKEQPGHDAESLLELAEQLKAEERARREEDRALRALAKSGMLSADNIQPAPQAKPLPEAGQAGQLAIESAALPQARTETAPVAATATSKKGITPALAPPVVSADNTGDALASPLPSAGEGASRAVLSADNTAEDSGAGQVAANPAETSEARTRVRQLGQTPEEQAATIREGCSPEELEALLEALMS